MKKNVFILPLTVLTLLTLMAVPAVATPLPFIELLPGSKINVWLGPYTISVSDTTHVSHGWATGPGDDPPFDVYPDWNEMSGRQRGEFMGTADFKLYINNEEIELRRSQWYDRDSDPDIMSILYWIVFDPDTFTPGLYTFRGEYSIMWDGTLHTISQSVSVIFVPDV